MVFNNVTLEDAGNYSCIAQNYYGESFKNVTLNVITSGIFENLYQELE